MPAKREQRAEINTFIQGLITEASPLNFPPNASSDEENFELNRDGSRHRRLGMDLESLTVLRDTGITTATVENAKFNTFKWVEVSGDPTLEFLAVQQNNRVSLFDLTKENLSADGFIGNITLSSFPSSTRFSFTSIDVSDARV